MSPKRIRSFALVCVAGLSVFFHGCAGSSNGGGSTTTPGGGSSTPVVTPTVSSISPTTVGAGAANTTITVTGTNFLSSSTVQVGSTVTPTTYVSATQLTATVPAAQLASGALLSIVVLNGSASSAAGAAVNLEVDNPQPVIQQLSPTTLAAGSADTTVSINGTGFVPTTTVQVNGTARPTVYVSGTQVSVTLSAADLAAAGVLSFTANNAAPAGGTSAAASLAINNVAPTITALTPSTVITGAATPSTITVKGTNFSQATTVTVNGAARTATVSSGTQLTFVLAAADQATAGRLSVVLSNPAPGGGASAPVILTVSAPTPTPVLTSVTPTSILVGSPDTTIQLTGTGFTTSSVAQWNGTALRTSYSLINTASGTIVSLYGTVPASLLTTSGTASVTVNSPTALQPLSNAISVAISNPPVPTLTGINPGAGPINTATKISLTGTGFTANSVVSFNGTALTTTYNSSTSLSVSLAADAVALPGNGSFTVTTPAPGGGASAAQVFTAYIPLAHNYAVYNAVDGLWYASIPGSAGAPNGNSIISIDPGTGAMGTPIYVGSEPNKLALSSDGKSLWVALDGSVSIRKVDLVAKKAGLQFSLPATNSGVYNAPPSVATLLALPGSTDSVLAYVNGGGISSNTGLCLWDAGVLRGKCIAPSTTTSALQADASRTEIYAGGSGLTTYTYSSAGLMQKAATSTNYLTGTTLYLGSYSIDEMQLLGGRLYGDFGRIYDAESGGLLGTLYLTGTTIAQGPTLAEAATSRVYVLDGPQTYSNPNQIQIFNLNDFTATATTIPVNVASGTYGYSQSAGHLSRWGANGLTFRMPSAIYSLRSNTVADLSGNKADAGVTLATSGATTTGGTTTFTATVTNAGPNAATDVILQVQSPSIGSVTAITASSGSCSAAPVNACSLGTIASGASTTVIVSVLQTTSGNASLGVQISGSTPDPVSANNTASTTVAVTGSAYALPPVLSALSPAAVQTGSTDTTVTLTGANFVSSTTASIDGTAVPTSVANGGKLTITVPTAKLANLGWSAIAVTTPGPGGGTSAVLPFTVFKVLTLGANNMIFDPFSRKIMASVSSGSSTVTGNSIVPVTPETGAVGTAVSVGSQPTKLALSSNGRLLYTILSGTHSVARFNMLSQQLEFTYTPPSNSSIIGGIDPRGIAVQPGNENTIALDLASFSGNALYDFNPTSKTATIRGQASGPYSGSCISFLDSNNLLGVDTDTSGFTFNHYSVTAAGFQYYNYSQYTESTLNKFGCFKLSGGLAFANAGGIADPAPGVAVQRGVLPGVSLGGGFNVAQGFAPDASLTRAFYPLSASSSYGSSPDGIQAYDLTTLLASNSLALGMQAIEGASTSYSYNDMVRWGQDGLAILTSGSHLYLFRGPAVTPQLLNQNAAASLVSSSQSTLAVGSGNTLLTLTGSGFLPGVVVNWNGNYRTTTVVDATHVTVAIPASDLATAATATVTAVNPGASASAGLTITIQ